ncbi:MAG: hypothetical protein COX65_02645 [Elusimicrobia bacterium CG_4_10_14_0_2_um_filter_56_8]|nr:MAG: hypothetical protein AUJ51_01605 [Elusimicrobia bacterium CG1_02_56_21]PJA16368.1 MAG: hypothetical protein COX65_02645 [Elusimicrobia bacterium CG_4_10_14_0_2_um_filter_56_8]
MDNILRNTKNSQSPEERQALSRLRQLLSEPGLLQASLFRRRRACGKSYCRCARSKRHWHASWHVGFSTKDGPRMTSIPEEWVAPVRLWIERYREAETLMKGISKLYWKRLKSARR